MLFFMCHVQGVVSTYMGMFLIVVYDVSSLLLLLFPFLCIYLHFKDDVALGVPSPTLPLLGPVPKKQPISREPRSKKARTSSPASSVASGSLAHPPAQPKQPPPAHLLAQAVAVSSGGSRVADPREDPGAYQGAAPQWIPRHLHNGLDVSGYKIFVGDWTVEPCDRTIKQWICDTLTWDQDHQEIFKHVIDVHHNRSDRCTSGSWQCIVTVGLGSARLWMAWKVLHAIRTWYFSSDETTKGWKCHTVHFMYGDAA